MKQGWEVKRLGEVYDVRDGTHDSPKYLEKGFPLITSKNLKNGSIVFENVNFISESDYSKINERSKVDKGDVLFAMIGTIGNPVVVHIEPNFAIKNVALLKVSKSQSSFYLKYYLDSKAVNDKMISEAKGSTQQFVGLGYLRSFPIPLPPLPEQQRIVSILDQTFAAINKAKENTQRNLQNAKELFESYLQGVFEEKGEGWERMNINEVCESIIDCVNKTAPVSLEKTSYKMIRTSNIRFGKVDLSAVKYVSEETFKKWTRRQKPIKGDILFTREAPMGEVGMLTNDENVFLGQRIVSYRINKRKADENFILYAFQSNDIKDQIRKLASGATVQHLRVPHTKEFEFAIPPLSEQQSIVSRLDSLSAETKRLEAIYQQKLLDLEELKKSVLEKAFRGEL